MSFEVEPAGDGKRRAVHVQRAGGRAAAPVPRPVVQREDLGRRDARGPTRFLFRALPSVLLVAALATYGFTKFNSHKAAIADHGIDRPVQRSAPAPAAPVRFQCDGRIYCSQMRSCEEATFFLKNCPGTRMDGDGDGIPCENQWC